MSQIHVHEILSLRYLTGLPVWSHDEKWLAYKWNDGGVTDLWLVPMQSSDPSHHKPNQITTAVSGVSTAEWHPTKNMLAYIMDGNLYLFNPEAQEKHQQLSWEGGYFGRISWHPQGSYLAATNGKTIFFFQEETAKRIDIKPIGDVFGGRFSQTVHGDSFDWSPGGDYFLYTWVDTNKKPYLALCTLSEKNIWRSSGHHQQISGGQWVNEHQLIYSLSGVFGAEFSHCLLTIPQKSQWKNYSDFGIISRFSPNIEILYTQKDDEKNLGFTSFTSIRPGGKDILFGLEKDGYLHHYLYNLEAKTLEQKTFGSCEDYGQAGDKVTWSPSGTSFLYASNRKNRVERHIWHYDLVHNKESCVIDLPVTNLAPVFSPKGTQFVYTHCDQEKNGDLWLYNFKTHTSKQLTFSMPEGLDSKLVKSQLIQYSGAKDWSIDAFLYLPQNFDPQKKYPAIVWVHGGPARQMRGSWHPSSTYALFYAFNQLLTSRGYVVLSPNFRGGIGYGRTFKHGLWKVKGQDDTIDIVNAGKYLKNLDYVDENKVAVYGLSYGGYMTLHSMTQYPEVFTCGINIAGLWDIAQWGFWMRNQYGNYNGDPYFLGDMEQTPELWAKGSPCTYKQNLTRPLLSLQGTADPNVDITQQDKLVRDCVTLGRGADFRAVYYPGENHTFRWRKTWQDAFPQMIEFFDQHLK